MPIPEAFTPSSYNNFTHNDMMFSQSINPTINGGTFQIYHDTIGTSEWDKGTQHLMAVT